MKDTHHFIDCQKCGGSGKVPLSEEMESTYEVVQKIGAATATQVKGKLDPKDSFHVSAFNNRLNDLVGAGLLERKRISRNLIYSVVKKTKTK